MVSWILEFDVPHPPPFRERSESSPVVRETPGLILSSKSINLSLLWPKSHLITETDLVPIAPQANKQISKVLIPIRTSGGSLPRPPPPNPSARVGSLFNVLCLKVSEARWSSWVTLTGARSRLLPFGPIRVLM